MCLDVGEPVFGGLRKTKVQTSLRIRASDQRLYYSLIGNYHIKNATGEISTFYLLSVAEQAGLRNPEERFSRDEAHMY